MQARYLEKGDIILKGEKRFTVNSVVIRKGRVIVETNGGRLSFKAEEQVTID